MLTHMFMRLIRTFFRFGYSTRFSSRAIRINEMHCVPPKTVNCHYFRIDRRFQGGSGRTNFPRTSESCISRTLHSSDLPLLIAGCSVEYQAPENTNSQIDIRHKIQMQLKRRKQRRPRILTRRTTSNISRKQLL